LKRTYANCTLPPLKYIQLALDGGERDVLMEIQPSQHAQGELQQRAPPPLFQGHLDVVRRMAQGTGNTFNVTFNIGTSTSTNIGTQINNENGGGSGESHSPTQLDRIETLARSTLEVATQRADRTAPADVLAERHNAAINGTELNFDDTPARAPSVSRRDFSVSVASTSGSSGTQYPTSQTSALRVLGFPIEIMLSDDPSNCFIQKMLQQNIDHVCQDQVELISENPTL